MNKIKRALSKSEIFNEYKGPISIDPLGTAMQTYRHVNKTKSKEDHSYLSLYHVKRQIAKQLWSVQIYGTNSSTI